MSKEYNVLESMMEIASRENKDRETLEESETKKREEDSQNAFYEAVNKDKQILEEYGIKTLFNEIVDIGIPGNKDMSVRIYESDNYTQNEHDREYKRQVYISLLFGIHTDHSSDCADHELYSEIRVAVISEKPHLVSQERIRDTSNRRGYSIVEKYSPIEKDNLAQTIANALLKPELRYR